MLQFLILGFISVFKHNIYYLAGISGAASHRLPGVGSHVLGLWVSLGLFILGSEPFGSRLLLMLLPWLCIPMAWTIACWLGVRSWLGVIGEGCVLLTILWHPFVLGWVAHLFGQSPSPLPDPPLDWLFSSSYSALSHLILSLKLPDFFLVTVRVFIDLSLTEPGGATLLGLVRWPCLHCQLYIFGESSWAGHRTHPQLGLGLDSGAPRGCLLLQQGALETPRADFTQDLPFMWVWLGLGVHCVQYQDPFVLLQPGFLALLMALIPL